MEKIIATEIVPLGTDSEILTFLEKNSDDLGLKDSVLYYGFPVFKDYEDTTVKSKFCILSPKHGIILLHSTTLHEQSIDDDNLSQLYSFVEAALKKSKTIRINRKKLAINLECLLFLSGQTIEDSLENECLTSISDIKNTLESLITDTEITDETFDEARSIIEGSKALARASKRTKVSEDPTTKLNILIELEKEVSNFDVEQRKIAISLINGPQRIRGLAGSGKTVVLAMKAAHIHLQHPNKKILFTFYTKSLYGLIKESIARFYRHFAGEEPNWEYIDVLHSWGGRTIDGVAYNACNDNNISSMPFSEAKTINYKDPFDAVCKHIDSGSIKQKYHYILIDEAQDLPNHFFHICYKLAIGELGREKNIVWGYDELQSIFNVYQRTPQELFGLDDDGSVRIDLDLFKADLEHGQSNDLVLYKCYRNPLEVLVTAHALGFAIYSEKAVQMLENKEHWVDVGYRIEENEELVVGRKTVIKREVENSPLSIYEYQKAEDIIQYFEANTTTVECQWIALNISKAINEGLKAHDILVICLDDRNAKSYFAKISTYLAQSGIRSNNMLLSNAAAPAFKLDDMVTLSTVHRAKGNEAAMVFTAGIDALYFNKNSRSGRNKIFTAFTRTKAWLRVSGVGKNAKYFFNEIDQSIKNSPSLIFDVPDAQEIETIQRDLNSKPNEMVKLQQIYGELIEKGYSENQIQQELKLFTGDK
ncbi:hypothetical protein A9267_05700 [Shewanella sp. UCD-FRSSP16_17]|uniref:DEAD/DEAH box helicase n=1 Tax=Shewanella sp. UCD-FRSSP16_17 TaxID=1853256 RepID=UPI0007EE9BCC|nr:ATP-binding domain-containing protein [Shewanella sp. UCD-FRSSP16_17]OBT10371.1 hypothetical protein A9267_05700 [Shewanella sp. UCD-FRSSP16_17]